MTMNEEENVHKPSAFSYFAVTNLSNNLQSD